MTAAMSVVPVSAAPRLPSAAAPSSGRPAMFSLPRECYPKCGVASFSSWVALWV